VAAQPGADERAEGHELEAAAAEVAEGAGDQPGAEPPPLEGGVDLGVDQAYRARLGPVVDEAGQGLPHPELVAIPVGVVDHARFRLHVHHLRFRLVTLP
jgi:hypothetical protein